MPVPLVIAAGLLLFAAVWDGYVLLRHGLHSGRTISWIVYSQSRAQPAIAFFFGAFALWLVHATGTNLIVALTLLVAGHIEGTMRGAK